MELVKGKKIKLTTDKEFMEKGNDSVVFVDYVNITKVVAVGNRIFVDDGLISLIAKEVGKFNFLITAFSSYLKIIFEYL